MKVMLLAAGKGTRMGELTQRVPKPLLQAGGRSLIEHQIVKLRTAGFDDLVINHAWLGSQLEAALGNGSQLGVRITWSPEGEPLETAGGIAHALPLLGDAPFMVVNADIWTDFDFASLRNALLPSDAMHLVLVANPPQHPRGDFSVSPAGRLQMRTAAPAATYTYSGIGIYRPATFANLPRTAWPLLPLIEAAILDGTASGRVHPGTWSDIGTPERLAALDSVLRSGTT